MKTYGKVFDALGDPTRRAILEALQAGPMNVSQLAQRVPVSRPAVSQHLKVLKDAHLVADRPSGTSRFYHISADGIAQLRAYLETFWDEALTNLKNATERSHKKGAS